MADWIFKKSERSRHGREPRLIEPGAQLGVDLLWMTVEHVAVAWDEVQPRTGVAS